MPRRIERYLATEIVHCSSVWNHENTINEIVLFRGVSNFRNHRTAIYKRKSYIVLCFRGVENFGTTEMQFTNENRTSSSRSFLNAHYQQKPVHCSSRERILPTKTRALFFEKFLNAYYQRKPVHSSSVVTCYVLTGSGMKICYCLVFAEK